jgi:hypothetical protein
MLDFYRAEKTHTYCVISSFQRSLWQYVWSHAHANQSISRGIFLKKVGERLFAKDGRNCLGVDVQTDYEIAAPDPLIHEQIEIGAAFMGNYPDVFAALGENNVEND